MTEKKDNPGYVRVADCRDRDCKIDSFLPIFPHDRITWNKGICHTQKTREKISQTVKEQYKHGRIIWNKGLTKDTDEHVRKYAQSLRGRPFSAETRHKMSESTKRSIKEGRKQQPKTKGMKIWSIHKHPQLGKHPSEDTRRRSSLSHIKRWKDPIYRAKVLRGVKGRVPWNKGLKTPQNILDKISEKSKALWKDPVYRHKVVEAVMKAIHKRPNRKEAILMGIIERNHLAFEYVGDGKVIIDGYCPDFINNNGGKQIIELYGDYWHRNQDPQKRMDHFKRYGFDALIIWEHELDDEEDVLKKIKSLS